MALALDEAVNEGKDLLQEAEGVSIVYDREIAPNVDDKIIDFQGGPQGGFSIRSEGPDNSCDSCCE